MGTAALRGGLAQTATQNAKPLAEWPDRQVRTPLAVWHPRLCFAGEDEGAFRASGGNDVSGGGRRGCFCFARSDRSHGRGRRATTEDWRDPARLSQPDYEQDRLRDSSSSTRAIPTA